MPPEEEREKLAHIIRQWNNNRLDLFEISQPDTNLVFQGVMRFYLEDCTGGNVATKCLRFCSNASTSEVVETLAEKFRPDMKMLSTCYSLYEIHGNKERKLDPDERPLVVQLNWNSDNREGRFVLKQSKETTEESCHNKEKGGIVQTFKRTLSRKDKKNKNEVSERTTVACEIQLNSISEAGQFMGKKTEGEVQADTNSPQHDFFDHFGLPLGIQLCDHSEEAFLMAVINYANSSTIHFKLSPAYALYAAGRFALQRPDALIGGISSFADKMVAVMSKIIQRQQDIAGALAFWMANTSELLNFFKHDKDLSRLTRQSQLDLSRLLHKAYSHLIQCVQTELGKNLPTFLIDPEQHGSLPAGIERVLNTLMNTMSVLRHYQVNPALAIQLFSQVFHFISTWLFNRLMNPDASTPGLCSHYWGAALRQRLSGIEAWAERQGLELAADCHLGHVIQATTLLTMNKYTTKDVTEIQNTCFKLNSLQLRALLCGYFYAPNEPPIPKDLIEAAVATAKASVDKAICQEGRNIELEENLDLHLPFLLPDGGYSCDNMRGIPSGFREFLEPICQRGLCYLTLQPNQNGDWTIFFTEPGTPYLDNQKEPETITVTLKKPLNSGMGVSIVAAKGAGQDHLGIYIKSIVKGGPAEMNGLLTPGDQLLSVDGQSLLGLRQERAAAIMMQTGPIVTLQVAKLGASYHGLGALLGDPASSGIAGGAKSQEIFLYPLEDPARHSHDRKNIVQTLQKNRRFYRSNPNMADFALEKGDELTNRDVRWNKSLSNLCNDTLHQGYLTLPIRKSLDKNTPASSQQNSSRPQQMFQVSLRPLGGQSYVNQRTFMRQALSQENVCVDTGGPLLDKSQTICTKQNYHSYLPVLPSFSTQNILVDSGSPVKEQRGTRAGVWRTPFSQQPTPTPSIQPVRIDVPITRPAVSHTNPPLTTFQHGSCLVAVRSSQTLQVNERSYSKCHIRCGPSRLSQQTVAKPQVSITPTKHVSFREPPSLEKQNATLAEPEDLKELNEKMKLQEVERRFQQKLREVRQQVDEVEDEQDLDMMVMIQQLEKREQKKTHTPGNANGDLKEQSKSLSTPKDEKTVLIHRRREDKTRRMPAPEKLPFKERQRLFSLASNA
nr:afadin-like [Nerophis lumbriciformis]